MKFALINKDNKVVNVVVWPYGVFAAPDEYTSIQSENARLGDIYQNGQFIKPDGSIRQ